MALMDKIVGVGVGLLVVAILLPIGIGQIAGANTTGWDPSVATVFTVLLPVLAVIGLVLYFMPKK